MADTQGQLDAAAVDRCAMHIINGNRRDARLAIRMHADPAWFVLEVLATFEDTAAHLPNLRRLMRGPHE